VPEPDPDPVPRPTIVPLATPGLPDPPDPASTPEPRRVAAFDAPAPAPAPVEADPVTESRPFAETVPVPVPPPTYLPLTAEPAAEEPAYVPPWRRGDDAAPPAAESDPESEAIGPSEPQPQDDFEFELSPEFASHAEPDPPTAEIAAESYPEPFTDLPAAETDPDPTTADNPELRQTAPAMRPVRHDQWDAPRATAPLPSVPVETYRAPKRAEPEYEYDNDDNGYDHRSHFAPSADTNERYVSVGGRTTVQGPEIIHGWDEPRPRRRLAREARPVVERRKAPRADETLQNVPVPHLAAGAAFGLFSLIVIGYLVHALL
jgi:hypothetical protein